MYYEVPSFYRYMIDSIEICGRSYYKVRLKKGFYYKSDDGYSSEYMIERYALFRSFGFIVGFSSGETTT